MDNSGTGGMTDVVFIFNSPNWEGQMLRERITNLPFGSRTSLSILDKVSWATPKFCSYGIAFATAAAPKLTFDANNPLRTKRHAKVSQTAEIVRGKAFSFLKLNVPIGQKGCDPCYDKR